jgi:hypothetical protein
MWLVPFLLYCEVVVRGAVGVDDLSGTERTRLGDIAFDFDGLLKIAVLMKGLGLGEGDVVVSKKRLLLLFVAWALNSESVRAFGDSFQVKGAVVAELGFPDVFLICWIFDGDMTAVDGVAITCGGDDSADGVQFAERDDDVRPGALFARSKLEGDSIALAHDITGIDSQGVT